MPGTTLEPPPVKTPETVPDIFREIEEHLATSNRKPWKLARRMRSGIDSRSVLEALGFQVGKSEGLFYKVLPPNDRWELTKSGLYSYVFDDRGNHKLEQYHRPHGLRPVAYLVELG